MCTVEKHGNIYILTLTGETSEHRVNPTLVTAIQSSLLQIKSDVTKSKLPSALITTSEGKFFSNGYDLAYATLSKSNAKSLVHQFQSLIATLLSLPFPTIAAVTGHASAAGFILAIAHDYVVMRKERGFLYMSELDIGLRIPKWFVAMVGCKIGEPRARKRVIMGAEKVGGVKGREIGVVDEVFEGGRRETVEGAVKMAEGLVKRGWDGEVYGDIRKTVFKEVFELLGFDETVDDDDDDDDDDEDEGGERRVIKARM